MLRSHISDTLWYLPFSFWLTSLCMIISTSIHVGAYGIISWFFMAPYLLYVFICQWIHVHWIHISWVKIYLRVGQVSFENCFICSAFHETVKQYSLMVVPFYVPISAVRESILLPRRETPGCWSRGQKSSPSKSVLWLPWFMSSYHAALQFCSLTGAVLEDVFSYSISHSSTRLGTLLFTHGLLFFFFSQWGYTFIVLAEFIMYMRLQHIYTYIYLTHTHTLSHTQ